MVHFNSSIDSLYSLTETEVPAVLLLLCYTVFSFLALDSAMDAAAQLAYCGVEPLRRTLATGSRTKRPSYGLAQTISIVRGRNSVILSVAAEPKPTEALSDASPTPKVVNGYSRSSQPNAVNGVSVVIEFE